VSTPPRDTQTSASGAAAPPNGARAAGADTRQVTDRPNGLVVVAAGVDNLYASAPGAPNEDALATALAHKAAAAELGEPSIWHLAPAQRDFLVKPHGWHQYPLWLHSPAMEVSIGDGRALPAVYLRLHSAFIHQHGVEFAVDEAERVRAALVDPAVPVAPGAEDGWPHPERREAAAPGALGASLKASRVDLYVDTQGWRPKRSDLDRFVSRAQGRHDFVVTHNRGRRFSGFSFGMGAVVARVYNKTLEIKAKGQTWPHAIWKDIDPAQPVWRVEFQFRREALQAFGVDTVAEVLVERQGLWQYGATQWLSLRHHPPGDSNRWRSYVTREWWAIQRAQIGSPCSPLVRERMQAACEQKLVEGLGGYATALAAAAGVDGDPERVLQLLAPKLSEYMRRKGTTFEDVVARKRELRLAL
jgi:hypothetical protein